MTSPRATNLSEDAITALRVRAATEAGPFVDPHLVHRIHVHNAEWASEILGRPFPGLRAVPWPELYLLHIARQEEPDPPLPTQVEARRDAAKAQMEEVQRRWEAQRRRQVDEWVALKAALPVRVEVRHNYTSHRHLGHYAQGADHIYLLEDLHVGRLSRPAGRVLCWTPSRAKDLAEFPEPADDGRIPSCAACWKIASRLTEKAVPFLRGGFLHEGR